MNTITNDPYHANQPYSKDNDNVSNSGAEGIKKNENDPKTNDKESDKTKKGKVGEIDLFNDMDLETLFQKNPDLKKAFTNMSNIVFDRNISNADTITMQELISCLIELGQALQKAAAVYANRLTKVTEKMNVYSKQMTQIPVVLKGDVGGSDDDRRNWNSSFSNMLEAVRANKGIEEDKAKKIQTFLQSMKDASQSANDFVGTFIDLLRGISQKIMK